MIIVGGHGLVAESATSRAHPEKPEAATMEECCLRVVTSLSPYAHSYPTRARELSSYLFDDFQVFLTSLASRPGYYCSRCPGNGRWYKAGSGNEVTSFMIDTTYL